MQHPEEGTIHAWLDGALAANEAAALESHVAACTDCAAAVAEARGLIAASSRIVGHLDAVPGKVIPAAGRRRGTSWRNPWLAAVAAGLILFVGYRNWTTSPGAGALDNIGQKPVVIRQPSTDSPTAVLPPPPRMQAQQAPVAANQPVVVGSLADSALTPLLPPANAARQKSSAPSAPPVAARRMAEEEARARDQAQRSRRLELSEMVVTGTADAGRTAATAAATAGGVARSPVPPAVAAAPATAFRRDLEAPTAAQAFTGCYEMNASTEILPARFALVDSATASGLMAIDYVDVDGRPTSRIADVGWVLEGGQVVVKTLARENLLTLRKTGSVVVGEARSGSRNGRVTSCRR